MLSVKDLTIVLVMSLNTLMAVAAPAAPASNVVVGNTNPIQAGTNARIDRCEADYQKLADHTDAKERAKAPAKRIQCNRMIGMAEGHCAEDRKAVQEATRDFAKACHSSGYPDLKKCEQAIPDSARECARLSTTPSSTTDTSFSVRRIYEFASERGSAGNKCVKLNSAEHTKQKAENEKTLAALDADVTKAKQALADRKKTLNDQLTRLAERKNEAQRKFEENSDKATQAASQEATTVMNQAIRLEADKAKASVELYEPKMKETQAYADEKVALKPFSDIRGMCIRELREKMVKDAALYRNSSDQFTASSLAKSARETAYWECVETFQTQVRAIKRSHQQARQGYRDQVRLIEQRIADLEKAKAAAQTSQAAATQRVAASNKRMGEILQEQSAALKTETDAVTAALAKTDEDHKESDTRLQNRIKEVRRNIEAMGASAVGDKVLADAGGALEALKTAKSGLEGQAVGDSQVCIDALKSLNDWITAKQLKSFGDDEAPASNASHESETGRPELIREAAVKSGGTDNAEGE